MTTKKCGTARSYLFFEAQWCNALRSNNTQQLVTPHQHLTPTDKQIKHAMSSDSEEEQEVPDVSSRHAITCRTKRHAAVVSFLVSLSLIAVFFSAQHRLFWALENIKSLASDITTELPTLENLSLLCVSHVTPTIEMRSALTT